MAVNANAERRKETSETRSHPLIKVQSFPAKTQLGLQGEQARRLTVDYCYNNGVKEENEDMKRHDRRQRKAEEGG